MKYILKSTFRNFIRKPVTNLINLLGLAVGLALVIILSVYCYSELTTDDFHKNGDRVYLYGSNQIYTPAILKDQIDLNLPAVESTVRIAGTWQQPVFQVERKDPIASDLIFADEDFFKLFTYQSIEGNLESALKEPMTIVITKSLSYKLFGREQAMGKTIKLNNSKDLRVTAVILEPRANSCLSFGAITSNATRKVVQPNGNEFTDWKYGNFQTFILLKKGSNPNEIAKNIFTLFSKDHQKDHITTDLIPLKNLYFSGITLSSINYIHKGDKKKVAILAMVAVLVLIIALINFINISSSQWMEKIRQTGVMKVIGAKRSTIIRMVLSEAFLLFLIAHFIAIILVIVVKPFIQSYTGIHYNPQLILSPGFLFISFALVFVFSILFSIIPAWRISSSKAVDNLKKSVEPRSANTLFRSILVAAQFTTAIVLISFTVLVQKQVQFGSNLGFSQENIVAVKLTPQLTQKKDVLKKELLQKSFVKEISFSQYYPGQTISHWSTKLNMNGDEKEIKLDMFNADASIFRIMGLKLAAGRLFTDDLSMDKGKIVVNETFLHDHDLSNPLGGKLIVSMDGKGSEIIGVVKDFHFKSVSEPITPLAIINESYVKYCLVNLQSGDFNLLHSSIQDIKAVTSELSPQFPVEISFFDQAIEKMYQSEIQFRRTFSLFAGCAILICCLGILAMSLSACEHRIKEIGIRKVNGAKISEILAMLNIDFVKWVAIAFVIATPIAYYAMHKWLENFAYKTTLSWWIFALAGLLALGIALLTVSWQSWKAATRNPVEALRYE